VVNVTVAVIPSGLLKRILRRTSGPSIRVSAPVPQDGTLGPAIVSFDNVKVSNIGTKAGYVLWGGSVSIGALATGPVSVDILDGGRVTDTLLL
jgi:hypothetical protein